MKKLIRVLVFGTFDIVHPGHEFFLKEAKKYGDILEVVVARDSTVKALKGNPVNDEKKRLVRIKSLSYVDKAYLGYKRDKYLIIEKLKPDVICLGYDQNSYTRDLKAELRRRGLKTKVIRIRKSFKPEKYKSSKLRNYK
ncbi:MAG: FAD synthase [Candidatus Aenigmarchaeota archaeon]|nr:FAD synthase [Candidatus Aenigmarchaeota archaeon]